MDIEGGSGQKTRKKKSIYKDASLTVDIKSVEIK